MILVTGSNGLLGTELKKHLNDAMWTTRQDFDITKGLETWDFLYDKYPEAILHLAAYTDVAGAEKDKEACWITNVIGTRNVAEAAYAYNIKMIYISTDYVFSGEKGNYTPLDIPDPCNYYGLTKLIGEQIVKTFGGLIIRTSFKPSIFPHEYACTDMFTSADYVDVIAPMIAESLNLHGICHIGTERKSIYDLIKKRNVTVKPTLRENIKSVKLPYDTSFGNIIHIE